MELSGCGRRRRPRARCAAADGAARMDGHMSEGNPTKDPTKDLPRVSC
eukprot:SAG25_NODE_1227_length_3562_cov_4.291943_3_plen_48_part_00